MTSPQIKITYIGGPTALLEVGGLRLLTDPTFDAPGLEYKPGARLHKTEGPAVSLEDLGQVDVVLLSHDHHFDNFDLAGKAMASKAGKVLTTKAGAERLRGNAVGLMPWEETSIPTADGRTLRITATPAQHGPSHMERGPVIGFVLSPDDDYAIYISGDTVWYEGVAEVGRRFPIHTAILNLGAARVPEVGPWNLTFTAEEAVQAAKAFPEWTIVPLHYEGWKHFSESKAVVASAFSAAGLNERLHWLDPGIPTAIGLR
jgi:L-ascorbate metabolism protein UlaG (beta-lactamase superfamily)